MQTAITFHHSSPFITSVPILADASRPDGSRLACYVFLTTLKSFSSYSSHGLLAISLTFCTGKWHLPLTSFKLNAFPVFYRLINLPPQKNKTTQQIRHRIKTESHRLLDTQFADWSIHVIQRASTRRCCHFVHKASVRFFNCRKTYISQKGES